MYFSPELLLCQAVDMSTYCFVQRGARLDTVLCAHIHTHTEGKDLRLRVNVFFPSLPLTVEIMKINLSFNVSLYSVSPVLKS